VQLRRDLLAHTHTCHLQDGKLIVPRKVSCAAHRKACTARLDQRASQHLNVGLTVSKLMIKRYVPGRPRHNQRKPAALARDRQ
jgi:hypothetical protein